MDKATKTAVEDLIRRAKKDPRKHDYTVYKSYKWTLSEELDLSATEYEQACKRLADALKV